MSEFQKRLNKLGFRTYSEYLKSAHWVEFRQRYKESNLLKECITCYAKKYELHHRSYVRLGNEQLNDVIPLCRRCHERIHEGMKNDPSLRLHHAHTVIHKVFGWAKWKIKARLKQFGIDSHVKNYDKSKYAPSKSNEYILELRTSNIHYIIQSLHDCVNRIELKNIIVRSRMHPDKLENNPGIRSIIKSTNKNIRFERLKHAKN